MDDFDYKCGKVIECIYKTASAGLMIDSAFDTNPLGFLIGYGIYKGGEFIGKKLEVERSGLINRLRTE